MNCVVGTGKARAPLIFKIIDNDQNIQGDSGAIAIHIQSIADILPEERMIHDLQFRSLGNVSHRHCFNFGGLVASSRPSSMAVTRKLADSWPLAIVTLAGSVTSLLSLAAKATTSDCRLSVLLRVTVPVVLNCSTITVLCRVTVSVS